MCVCESVIKREKARKPERARWRERERESQTLVSQVKSESQGGGGGVDPNSSRLDVVRRVCLPSLPTPFNCLGLQPKPLDSGECQYKSRILKDQFDSLHIEGQR